MILVDFDRTIFDSDRFYEFVRNSLPVLVSQDSWQNMYKAYQQQHTVMNIFSLIEQNELIKGEALTAFMIRLSRHVPDFVYEDAKTFLARCDSLKMPVSIFSYGDTEFQKYKIFNSECHTYSPIITDMPKRTHKSLGHAVLWIDDNPNEFIDSKNDLQRILLCRPGGKYSETMHKKNNWKSIESLDQIKVTSNSDVRIIR